MQQTLAALASGSLVGFTLGLIGGGGSVLATPLLLYFVGITNPHVALGTGALAVSVNAYVNLIGHARKGHVLWRCAILFALVGTVGAVMGSSLGKIVNGQSLLFMFGIVMVIVGGLMLRPRKVVIGAAPPIDRNKCIRTGLIAIATGLASGFFGIGGGFLIVPALIFATEMATINAVGTSLLAVGTFGLATATNYAISGLIDWPIAIEFIMGGLAGGFAGMMLATRLSGGKDALNRVFAVLIFTVAAYVLYRSGETLFM